MQIKIDLKIFLFLLIFVITRQIKIYAILMLFAFVHELGHLIYYLKFIQTKSSDIEIIKLYNNIDKIFVCFNSGYFSIKEDVFDNNIKYNVLFNLGGAIVDKINLQNLLNLRENSSF